MNQGKTTQIRCSNLGHLPQIWANLLFFLSFSNRNYFLKKTFLQDPFYEKFSHAETHDSAKKPCRSTHSFSSSSNPEMVPKVTDFGTFLARRTVLQMSPLKSRFNQFLLIFLSLKVTEI